MKTKTKLSPRFWAALTLFSLIGQVAWVVENMYLNVFIYKMFHASETDISLMVAASAAAATVTTYVMGTISDRVGKRKLFICSGYILWGISILCFALLRTDILGSLFPMAVSAATLGITLTIIMDCVMTFFGSTANDAAFNAWVTDSTDNTTRGAVEGINAMMPLLAILVVFGGFMAFDLSSSTSWTLIFCIIGGIVLLIGVLGIFLIPEPPIQPIPRKKIRWGRFDTIRKNPVFHVTLLLFCLFNISIQIFMPYLLIYYEISLGMANYVLIMAPAILLASIVTVFWGKVYDKKGFTFSAVISLLWLIAGYLILFFCRTTLPVFLGSLLMMCGYLGGMAVFGARLRDNTPPDKVGTFQGRRIAFQVLFPGVAGPAIGAAILQNAEQILNNDGTYSFVPNANIFLGAMVAAILVLFFVLLTKTLSKHNLCRLETPWEKNLSDIPWDVYPRPQMKRDSFFCLNGRWALTLRTNETDLAVGHILIPFCPESALSGIETDIQPNSNKTWIYRRSFSLPEDFIKDRVLLHFGAVDQKATVLINDQEVGSHSGGYLPFHFDITSLLQPGENTVSVLVEDSLDQNLPYGKQCKKRGGMWYTPVTGIWQSVWMESVPADFIHNLHITPSLTDVTITVLGGRPEKSLILETEAGPLSYHFTGDTLVLPIKNPHLWTPEDPYLYAFTLQSGEDEVDSYFALRTITSDSRHLLLNDKPYFFHGLLDQGYFSDGIFLPATPDGYRTDILTMKELGFNTLRKHIKVEPEQFYYDCDRFGMIVFQDMINNGAYSFLTDTALPTLGYKKKLGKKPSSAQRTYFEECAHHTLTHLYNHPCVCYYTIFNEGWGQYDEDRLYRELKALDPSRIWDATSGWFAGQESDVQSEHIYFRSLDKLKADGNRPLVLSEFGGYSYSIPEHIFNLDASYGYGTCKSADEFEQALEHLYLKQIIPAIERGLCASILTQLSDVEDEINGLFTYDRQILKVEPARMRAIAEKLFEAFIKNC